MATESTDIDALKDKKLLQFPEYLGSALEDAHGNDVQYMMIRIVTDASGQLLRNDGQAGQAYETARQAQGIGVETDVYNRPTGTVDSDVVRLYGAEVALGTELIAKKGKIKLDKVIVLPMPNNYDVNTSVMYDTDYDPGLLTKAGDMLNSAGSGLVKELATLGKNKVIAAAVNAITTRALGKEATNSRNLLAEEGLAINPKKEVMFEKFGFRTFNFRYTFAPKNKRESEIVREIIETLRYYSLPAVTEGKLFFLLPAEFQIEFMLGNRINPNIPRIANSFLSRIQVNYAPGNVWASLPNGAPVAVDVSLEFQENELVDRTRVYDKNNPITSGY